MTGPKITRWNPLTYFMYGRAESKIKPLLHNHGLSIIEDFNNSTPACDAAEKRNSIATLGPASSTEEIISDLFDAGVDVFRINFGHGSHEDLKQRVEMIRRIEEFRGRPIGVLMDIQGPKMRF